MVENAKFLAEILGISERRVNQIASEGKVFKREEDGKYDIPLCVHNFFRDKYDVADKDEAKKLMYDAELKKLKAEEAELKNAIARGAYVKKDEITAELQRFFVVLKRSMISFSRRIAIELSPYVETMQARRIEKMVRELTVDALEQISINGVYEPPTKQAKNKASAKAKSEAQ